MTDYERALIRIRAFELLASFTFPDPEKDVVVGSVTVAGSRGLSLAERKRWADEIATWAIEDREEAAGMPTTTDLRS